MTDPDAPWHPPQPSAYPTPTPTSALDTASADSGYDWFEPLPANADEPPKNRRRLVIGLGVGAVVVGAAVAVGLSISHSSVDAHTAIKTTTEPNATLGTLVHSHGITVDLPKDWTNLPTSPAELKAMAARLAHTHPDLAKSITQLSTNQLVDHFALLAVRGSTDPTAPIEDLDVVVGAAGGLSLDALSLETKTQLAAAGATDVTESTATVGTLPAFKVAYTLTLKTAAGTRAVPAEIFGVIGGGNVAEIVFYNPGDGVQAQTILDSFTFG